MEFYGDDDPILILNNKLIDTVADAGCLTSVAALALLLSATLEIMKRKSPEMPPASILELQGLLGDLIVDVLGVREMQRMQES